ncbi:hypothetical protein D3C81_1997830 [compost metagenome]
MVCLVVEEVGKRRCDSLTDRANIGCRHISEATSELFRIHAFNIFTDALIFGPSHVAELDEIVSDNSIKLIWMITFASKALHPDTISNQQMVEGAVH